MTDPRDDLEDAVTTLTPQQVKSLRLAHAFAGFGSGRTCRMLLEEAFPELDYYPGGNE